MNQYQTTLEPYLTSAQPIPSTVQESANAFFDQAQMIAGGSVTVFLQQAMVGEEMVASQQSIDIGLGQTDAPPYAIYYAATIQSARGSVYVVRGMTSAYGQYSVFVGAADSVQNIAFFDPRSNSYGLIFPLQVPLPYAFPRFYLVPLSSDYADRDGDGLADVAESVVGTDAMKYSTAGDGISDLAKVQEGLNPFGNYPFPHRHRCFDFVPGRGAGDRSGRVDSQFTGPDGLRGEWVLRPGHRGRQPAHQASRSRPDSAAGG
jgi:hypothetical protein